MTFLLKHFTFHTRKYLVQRCCTACGRYVQSQLHNCKGVLDISTSTEMKIYWYCLRWIETYWWNYDWAFLSCWFTLKCSRLAKICKSSINLLNYISQQNLNSFLAKILLLRCYHPSLHWGSCVFPLQTLWFSVIGTTCPCWFFCAFSWRHFLFLCTLSFWYTTWTLCFCHSLFMSLSLLGKPL